MKLTVNKKDLAPGISLIKRAAASKSTTTLPILYHVLLEARNKSLRLSGTDLSIGLTTRIPATVLDEGSVTVPASLFDELVRNLGDAEITMTLNQHNYTLTVKAAHQKANVRGLDPDDFPRFTGSTGSPCKEAHGDPVSLEGDLLISLINRTAFAAGKEISRPVLTAVAFEFSHELGARLLSADGYRLSITAGQQASVNNTSVYLVPATALDELKAMITKDARVLVYGSNSHILFQAGETSMVVTLVEGNYPNLDELVWGQAPSVQVTIESNALEQALKATLLFAHESDNRVLMHVGNGGVRLSAISPEVGDSSVVLDAQVEGVGHNEEFTIAFNGKFMQEAMGAVGGQARLQFIGPDKPIKVQPAKDPDSFIHLIMPMAK